MPKRVLLDGTKLLDSRTDGIKRYVVELTRALAEADLGDLTIDVALTAHCVAPLGAVAKRLTSENLLRRFEPALLSEGADNPLLACRERVRQQAGLNWSLVRDVAELQAWKFTRSCLRRWGDLKRCFVPRREAYDLVHLALPNTFRQLTRFQGPRLTTVHDISHLTCPDLQTAENNHSLAQGLVHAQRIGSRYLAVSRATAQELHRRQSIPRDDIDVVHQGVDHARFKPGPALEECLRVRRRYDLPEAPFLLSLGTIEPRKNLVGVVQAFLRLAALQPDSDVQLVIGGYRGWGDHGELDRLIADSPRVRTIGYLHEDDLPTLYGMCRAFCYVSHYEGFGLPLLEAMSCGAPVIHGDNSSMPEVVGRGGIGVAAHHPPEIAAAMHVLLNHPEYRDELAAHALRQASCFDWRHTAAQTVAIYEQCLAGATPRVLPVQEARRARAA